MSFGAQLRSWREVRGFSQLRLATSAEVSQRHISFLETGRSSPSREMVIHLGRILRVPLEEQNHWLLEAGFAPAFGERSVQESGEVGEAIDFLLAVHEPNMAVVVDRRWRIVGANQAARRLTSVLAPDPPLFGGELNLMYALFHPDGFGDAVINRSEVASMLLWRLADDLDRHPTDSVLRDLHATVRGLAGDVPAPGRHDDLIGTIRFRIGDDEIGFFSCLTRLENARDLTLDGLRIETFFPSDPSSTAAWARFAAG